MSQALESADQAELTREEVRRYYKGPLAPPRGDPNYKFEKKTPDQYPSKTHYDFEQGSKLTDGLGKMARAKEFTPGEGKKSSATMYLKKTKAQGEIGSPGMSANSYLDKYGSARK